MSQGLFKKRIDKVMFNGIKNTLLYTTVCCLLIGCSHSLKRNDDYRYQENLGHFVAIDIKPLLMRQNYKQKHSHIIVLIDDSFGMKRKYKGYIKQEYLEIIYKRMIKTIPGSVDLELTEVKFGGLNQKSFTEALLSSMTLIKPNAQDSTMLILSEWSQVNKYSQKAVKKLLYKFGNSLCINMIGIGNIHQNKMLMEWENCGLMVDGESIATPIRMADFVRKLLFSEPSDFDGDGIYDYMDRCPNSEKGAIINWLGCKRDSATSHLYYQLHDAM